MGGLGKGPGGGGGGRSVMLSLADRRADTATSAGRNQLLAFFPAPRGQHVSGCVVAAKRVPS